MSLLLSFIRLLFFGISLLMMTAYATHILPGGLSLPNALLGIFAGLIFSGLLLGAENLLRRLNLKAFNIAALGLFAGYMMGTAVILLFDAAFEMSAIDLTSENATMLRIIIYLFSVYLGMIMTARAAEEISISIPFVKFKAVSQKKKDLLLDQSSLADARLIDLASTGLLDHQLLLPRFIIKDLYTAIEKSDEPAKSRARKSLEVVKKMEGIPHLNLRYIDTDFPEIKENMTKLTRLARFMDANIMTSDINRIQQSILEGVSIINLHMLSNALKPLTQMGEFINIKVQRYGKEPRQGIGYLEDGTMVVINGGAEFIGETIKVQVLSVKHTTSGRMIFSNASEENLLSDHEYAEAGSEHDSAQKSFYHSL